MRSSTETRTAARCSGFLHLVPALVMMEFAFVGDERRITDPRAPAWCSRHEVLLHQDDQHYCHRNEDDLAEVLERLMIDGRWDRCLRTLGLSTHVLRVIDVLIVMQMTMHDTPQIGAEAPPAEHYDDELLQALCPHRSPL